MYAASCHWFVFVSTNFYWYVTDPMGFEVTTSPSTHMLAILHWLHLILTITIMSIH